MRKRTGWLVCLFTLALLCMAGAAAAQEENGTVIIDDVEPYDGPIGPGSPLYGLKIAFEDLDLTFTTNETEYVNKLVKNGRLRLSEVRSELQQNNTEAAERALALYMQTTNATRLRLQICEDANATGLLHAQQMVAKHQLVLQNLQEANPNSTGLARAYNNSLALEQKFEEKTQTRLERLAQKNNETFLKAVRLEIQQQQRTENDGNQTLRIQETNRILEKAGTDDVDDNGQPQAEMTPGSAGETKGQKKENTT